MKHYNTSKRRTFSTVGLTACITGSRCQDYLQIRRPLGGDVEECGTTPSTSSLLELESGNFTVVFRTSEDDVVGDGFEMYIICYRPSETKLPGESTCQGCFNGGE